MDTWRVLGGACVEFGSLVELFLVEHGVAVAVAAHAFAASTALLVVTRRSGDLPVRCSTGQKGGDADGEH